MFFLNGLIVQWGVIPETHGNQTVTINFSISFSNTNYYVNELPFKTEKENGSPYDSNYKKNKHLAKLLIVYIFTTFVLFQILKYHGLQ